MTGSKAYLYVELDVLDADRFLHDYMRSAQPILRKYGARVLVSTDQAEVLEGVLGGRQVVLLEFEDRQHAREFYHSNEYQRILALRLTSAKTHTYKLLEGLPRRDR
jgi:uncharacterized protein (DUF1330 family)